jgi:prepilin signal peptidase PulO-like enzyme (type II secretory pathway)
MQLPAAREGAAACEVAASTRTPVFPMSRETLVPLVLAALFTLGCITIHAARRHPDAVTLALFLLLGFLAVVYVGQHTRLDARHLNWQHEAFDLRQPLPTYPMM